MILNGPGKISIMVGGQVVGMAKEAKFSIAEDDASTNEFSDPWRTPDIKQSWDISCDAMVRDAGNVMRDLLNGKEKWDVTIGQEVGKMPRKMKKAYRMSDRYQRDTKWKRKAKAYARRFVYRLPDAEMVVTREQMGVLEATIKGSSLQYNPDAVAHVSGKDIAKDMAAYVRRRSMNE